MLTAKFKVIEDMTDIGRISLEYPLFAKPVSEGTGKGISDKSLIESSGQLAEVCEYLLNRFAQPVLIEEFSLTFTMASTLVPGLMFLGLWK